MYYFRSGSMRSHSIAVTDFRMALLSFDRRHRYRSIYAFYAETCKMDYSALIYCYCYCYCYYRCFVYTIELVMMLLCLFASTFCLCLIGLDTFYQYHNHFLIPAFRYPMHTTCRLAHNSYRNCWPTRFVHDLQCDETMRHWFYLVSTLRTNRSTNRLLSHCKINLLIENLFIGNFQ